MFWAFIYNLIDIPVAAGLLYPVNGFLRNPMIAGAAMALTTDAEIGVSEITKNSVSLNLDSVEGIEKWEVDIMSPNKVLIVVSDADKANEVRKVVEKAGFKAEVLWYYIS